MEKRTEKIEPCALCGQVVHGYGEYQDVHHLCDFVNMNLNLEVWNKKQIAIRAVCRKDFKAGARHYSEIQPPQDLEHYAQQYLIEQENPAK